MKEYIKKFIVKHGVRVSLLFIIVVILLNASLIMYYRTVLIRTSETSNKIQVVTDGLSTLSSHIWLGDLGVRAYLIKQTDQFLDPYTGAKSEYNDNLLHLENNLSGIGFDVGLMQPAKVAINNYMEALQLMVDLCDVGRVDEALEIFYEDRGLTAWQQYSPFLESANSYITELKATSEKEYKDSIDWILIIQIRLIFVSIPILILAYRKIMKDNRFRANIFDLIYSSNKDNLFDDSIAKKDKSEESIVENLISNLKNAAHFINSITKGNYDISWEGMDEKSKDLNKNNIAGELIMMKDQMMEAKNIDEIRIWTNEGLSNFADLVRNHQNDLNQLSEELISNIVIYLNAHQGGLFFLNDDDDNEKYLELMGCYAYQRKKFVDKRIEIGQGMVGQCFLEGETTYITNIPEEYVNITSGLGNTNPRSLLIVPLMINEEVVGIVEIASLKAFEKHQIEFLERIAEIIASAISTVKRNEKNQVLLEQSQQQSEEMRAQEEEMRQNMEELQATQEQMHRKNEDVENLLEQASAIGEDAQIQLEESKLQEEKMRAQEEELKQNMEELQATQEQMQKKNEEVESLLEQASANEESMKMQMAELEEIQEEAKVSHKKADAILANSQEAILLISKKTLKIDLANTRASELTGYTQEELTNLEYTTIFKFLKLDKIKQGDKKRQKVIRKDQSKFMADIFVGEEIINNEEMFLLFLQDVTLQIKQEQEIVLRLETDATQKHELQIQENELRQNIEEMKAQEEELHQNMEEMQAIQDEMEKSQHTILENNKKTDAILANSQEAIVLISKDNMKIDVANEMMTTLTGYSKKELNGLEYSKIFKFLKLDKIKQGDKKRQKLIRKDQRKFMADIFVGEEIINDEAMFLLFVQDVTLQIKQEQEIVMSLEASEKQKREFETEIEKLKRN